MYITTRTYWQKFAAGISEHHGSFPYRVYRADGMDAWVMLYTLKGSGIIGDPENRIIHHPGDLLLIPAGIPHDYRHLNNERWQHMWIYFYPEERWLNYLQWPSIEGQVMMLTTPDSDIRHKLDQAFHEIIDTYQQNSASQDLLCTNLVERILLLCHTFNPLQQEATIPDSRLDKIKNFLLTHYSQAIDIDQLASMAQLSKSRLSVLFKQQTGQTIIDYLTHIRLQAAISQLLAGNKPIKQIAASVGYHCPFYFSRIFQKQMGVSPRQFRNRAD